MNNTTEYEGLLAGLRIAADLGIRKLVIRGDSQLVVKQVNKDYQSPLMEAYVDEMRKLEERFDGLQAEHVPRAENNIADDLSKRAALKLPGRGAVKRAGLEDQRGGTLSRFGPQVMRNTLVLLWCIFGVLEILN